MNEQGIKTVWPGWNVVQRIGTGSYGAVYEVAREMFGHTEKAAVKVVSVPQKESEIEELRMDGYDLKSITARYRDFMQTVVREYSMMAEMKGCANIVYCDDVRCIQHADGIGWDIFIKMELLTPLAKTLYAGITEAQVIKLGAEMSNALAFCEQRKVLHRDIKPQNIFVAADGTYKLGDFGVAKTVEKTLGGTVAGTYNYMAPEVFNNQPYGARADIYSLGLVLYWLLNEKRLPFLPLPPEVPTAPMEESARARRFRGEPIPAPVNGSQNLRQLVLTACAFDPNARFSSAEEMRQRFAALAARPDEERAGFHGSAQGQGASPPAHGVNPPAYGVGNPSPYGAGQPAYGGYDPAAYGANLQSYFANQPGYTSQQPGGAVPSGSPQSPQTKQRPKKKRIRPWLFAAGAAAVVTIAVLGVVFLGGGGKQEPEGNAAAATAAPPTQTASPPVQTVKPPVPTETPVPVWTAAPETPTPSATPESGISQSGTQLRSIRYDAAGRILDLEENINGTWCYWQYLYDENGNFLYRKRDIRGVDCSFSDDCMPGTDIQYSILQQPAYQCVGFSFIYKVTSVRKGDGLGPRILWVMDGNQSWTEIKRFEYNSYDSIIVDVVPEKPITLAAFATPRLYPDDSSFTVAQELVDIWIADDTYASPQT